MKLKMLLVTFVFLVMLPFLARACTTHDQCSQACNSLGYGSCPFGVYGCMIRDCCIGQCRYWSDNQCFCLATTHVDIYGDVCPSGSVCDIKDCLCHPGPTPQPVCTSGDTKNRYCACQSQVAYEKCKSDGSGWQTMIENCPSGTVCDSGFCVSVPTCTAKYLDNYRCSDSWVQREYQYSDCTTTWVSWKYCSDGCYSGYCQEAPEPCTAKYLDEYRCYGGWSQRRYRYSDCTYQWVNYEYCDNYCSNGHCVQEEACQAAVMVSTPDDGRVGDTITSMITIENSGGRGGYVSVDAYVCMTDPSCSRMSCNGYDDPTVYVNGHGSQNVYCTAQMDEKGTYQVKAFYSGCGDSGTVYSGSFEVWEQIKPSCTARYLDSYRCSGSWRQQLYRYSSCNTDWVNIEFCSYGCSDSKCLAISTTTTTLPTTTTTLPPYQPWYTGWIVLWGGAVWFWPLALLLLALLVLMVLLFGRECICYRAGPRRVNRPEQFRECYKVFKV